MRAGVFLAVVAVTAVTACEDDLAQLVGYGQIAGEITYAGTAHEAFAEPAILVAATVEFPPIGPAHAALVLVDPDFGRPVEFVLPHVAPHDYYVLAQLTDLSEPIDPAGPMGGYASFCDLGDLTVGNVEVSEGEKTALAEPVQIYDGAGTSDPCIAERASLCPDPGTGTLALEIRSSVDSAEIQPSDILAVGLFDQWPAQDQASPLRTGLIPGTTLSFPQDMVFASLEPGGYAAAICFDRGGDDILTGGCGDEDFATILGEDELQTVDADTIVEVVAYIDTGSVGEPVVRTSVEAGCGEVGD